MGQIIISTTFREFEGNKNDDMQLRFLRSPEKQTFQNFVLVVTVFSEKKVEKTVRTILQDRCFFIYDEMNGNYQFSLSKTFINGVDYGLKHEADILLDCSSDVVLQKDFLETISNNCPKGCAGISHPNIFVYRKESGEHKFKIGSISKGIDARFFSLELFRNQKVYQILQTYPSYDYGAGIEAFLCGIAIKYAKERTNIFMESKVIKEENSEGI